MKYPCQFCGAEFPTRSSRKTHNKKCDKNTERENNQKRTATQRKKQRKRLMSPSDFAEIYDDLSDGAFFAMAEEMGIEPEDFCE